MPSCEVGDSPILTTPALPGVAASAAYDLESLPLAQMLTMLLGKEGRRILNLRNKSNEELFRLWRAELGFRYSNEKALKEASRILARFEEYLGGYPPSAELAKSYIGQFIPRKNTTAARYSIIIGQFMKWYGDPLDIKIKLPKVLPQMVDPRDTDKIIEAMSKSRSRRSADSIVMVQTMRLTGLRRSEAANLKVGDLDFVNKVLVVRDGKGGKDRSIPLVEQTSDQLQQFCAGKGPEDSVFGIRPGTVSAKISAWAKKAGCPHIHAHSLRHEFATQLARNGASARAIQMLMGHSDMATSQRYIDLSSDDLRGAVNKLDGAEVQGTTAESEPEESRASRTTLIITAVNTRFSSSLIQEYFSHFEVLNEGDSAAIEVEVALLESSRRVLERRRLTALLAGKQESFKPEMFPYEGSYYIVCQYKGVEPKSAESWCQTWLPFSYSKAEAEGRADVVAGELQFKYGLSRGELVEIFLSKPE